LSGSRAAGVPYIDSAAVPSLADLSNLRAVARVRLHVSCCQPLFDG
jgi:hypothetical protein